MSVKRHDFDCYAFYDSARLNVQECDDGDYVLHSDYTAIEEERDKLAREVMRLVNINEQLHERHNALREAVAWERECEKCWTWLKPTTFAAMRECYNNFEAARAEVDRLLQEASNDGHS